MPDVRGVGGDGAGNQPQSVTGLCKVADEQARTSTEGKFDPHGDVIPSFSKTAKRSSVPLLRPHGGAFTAPASALFPLSLPCYAPPCPVMSMIPLTFTARLRGT